MSAANAKINVGVVGVGFGRVAIVPAFRKDARCQVVAVCARNPQRVREAQDALQIEHGFTDWRELTARKDIHAIAIAVPPSAQYEIAMDALNNGKAVFCDKPLAATLDQAKEMSKLAQERKLANIVNFEFPEVETWARAKEIIDKGDLGDLSHAVINWQVETAGIRLNEASWRTEAEMGGGILSTFACHSFHYVEWFLGKIERISARLTATPGAAARVDSSCFICLQLRSGVTVSLNVSGAAFLGSGHRLEFYGRQGSLVLHNDKLGDHISGFHLSYGDRQSGCLSPVDCSAAEPKAAANPPEDSRIKPVAKLVSRFLTWIEAGAPAAPNFADGLRVQQLMAAARESHLKECWVKCHQE